IELTDDAAEILPARGGCADDDGNGIAVERRCGELRGEGDAVGRAVGQVAGLVEGEDADDDGTAAELAGHRRGRVRGGWTARELAGTGAGGERQRQEEGDQRLAERPAPRRRKLHCYSTRPSRYPTIACAGSGGTATILQAARLLRLS